MCKPPDDATFKERMKFAWDHTFYRWWILYSTLMLAAILTLNIIMFAERCA